MKILVTGGTGYIGSHTVVELQRSGYEVLIADNLSNSEIGVVDRIAEISGETPHFENIDLCDAEATAGFFCRNKGIEGVIHFAAFKAVEESVKNPLLYYHNNLISLINLLREMETHAVNNLVFSSSCTVYGQPDILPVTEDSPVKPAFSPYGKTKQICEDILSDLAKTGSRTSSIMLRYFNPIGAHPSALIGELPLGVPNNLMPFITQTAAGLRDYLRVFGHDYNTSDGTAIRDYIHVTDLADAHIAALKRLTSGTQSENCEVFNIGTGRGYSVLQVIESFIRTTGISLDYRMTDRRAGDVEQVWADTQKAEKVLGWKSKLGLDDMTLSAWKWQKQLHNKHK